jgi:hypothetical protein
MTTRIDQWQERIQRIKKELVELGDMRPGSLTEQYNVCGKAGCRCKDPKEPKKHGPYYQISYTHMGKSTSEFVKKHLVAEARQQLRNYARFKKLTDEWVALSLKIIKARKKSAAG